MKSYMRQTRKILALALGIASSAYIYSQDSGSSTMLLLEDINGLEVPLCRQTSNYELDIEDHEVHQYTGFTLCYRESYEQAEWVAYCLTKEELQNKVVERSNDFEPDPKITTGSAVPWEYLGTGYDRGHLCPAADMKWSAKAMADCFLMSNMSPQAPGLNQHIWNDLENKVRSWAYRYGAVYVVTGPVLEKPAKYYKQIGENKVAVPEYYYKVLLAQRNDKARSLIACAYIMPNRECEKPIADYAVTIDEVENRTKLDFFHLLPDDKENRLERSVDLTYWK